jgi:uncharacterized membrane protein
MTIVANVTYHVCSKKTASINPLAALSITYAVALVTCLILYPFFTKHFNFIAEVKSANWASVILGFAIVLLEIGFILAYRAGWHLGYAVLFSNVFVTLILIPIALFIFKDQLSGTNWLGIILAITGLTLMVR